MVTLKRFFHRLFLMLVMVVPILVAASVFARLHLDIFIYLAAAFAVVVCLTLAHLLRPKPQEGGLYNLVASIVSGAFTIVTSTLGCITAFFAWFNSELEPFVKASKDLENESKEKRNSKK